MLVVAVAIAGVACGPSAQSFQPAENVQGTTIEGLSAAFYDLGGSDQQIGSVKVWSRGAYEADGNTLVNVGFTIDNGSDQTIAFEGDQTVIESMHAAGQVWTELRPAYGVRTVFVAPRSSQDVELTFVLPRGVDPDEVQGFRTRWTTSTAQGERFTEFTPFVQHHDEAYVPVYAYYDPYHAPYWRPYHRVIVVREHPRRVIVHGDRDRPRPQRQDHRRR